MQGALYELAKEYNEIIDIDDFPYDFYYNLRSIILRIEFTRINLIDKTDDEYDSDNFDEFIDDKIFKLGKIIVTRSIEELENKEKSKIPWIVNEEYNCLSRQTESDSVIFFDMIGEE